ncbi:hypothetical protein [Methanoregula sp.]|uniref:hypothetical protein n=1 Tax=Methanoregula sp. TaxID=2052170 RepID=UPI00236DC25C|nr:hypothetical protein [Methanoregula sp.]MDD1686555.1 hypothetical protein [Methanoregula sp.]
MGSPYLNSNETIVLSTHNVVINTIPAEAILTNQRLILVDARNTQLRPQDIPFTALETITIGDNTAMDPVLSLSIVLRDESRHTLGITFPQGPKAKRVGERDEWATRLKEASVGAQQEDGVKPADLEPPWVAGDLPEDGEKPADDKEAREEKYYNPPLMPRKPRAAPVKGNRMIVAAGLVIILIIAAVIGIWFYAPPSTWSSGAAPVPTVTATPPVTAVITETPVVTEVPTTQPTETPTPAQVVTAATTPVPQVLIPETGVWVRIEYTGNYTASIGTSGAMREISGSGTQVYQVPAKDIIVDASVDKLDDSGTLLTVSIYSNGKLVNSGTTTSPHATLDVHADLRTPAPTPTVTKIVVTAASKSG